MRPEPRQRTGRSAALVAVGILCSRLVGLVRQRVIAHYFGLTTDVADAWAAGFRIPNLVQNLFGEGALSASFIPVYASLVARGDRRQADRVAGAVGSLLALVVSGVVLVGVVATPWLIDVIAPGFTGDRRALTIAVVRILFPGMGLLVLSAWCLGILNSHHRFLLSYTAPVTWSAAMIAALAWFGETTPLPRLVEILAWGSVVGSALQLGVQLPMVLKVAPDLRAAIDTSSEEVRTIVRNFFPAFFSRGVVQVSAYIDTLLASLLPVGAVAGLTNATTLYTLPVSLFGVSVSAAELPVMSSTSGTDATGFETLRGRLDAGLRRIAFFVIPSAMAFLALGDVVAAALLQTGRFRHADAIYVWAILAGSSIGLLASTLARLYASTCYALRDTRTPLRYAIVRVSLTTVLGYLCAIPVPRLLGIPPAWGASGLTASAGVAGWVEMLLLRRALNTRIGQTGLPPAYVVKLWTAAACGAIAAWAVKLLIPPLHPVIAAIVVLGPYGVVFFACAFALRVPEVHGVLARLRRSAWLAR
ncbi:MAG: murein biosynthesis integral membrane protein MurJ [Acidobacteriota bacterium]